MCERVGSPYLNGNSYVFGNRSAIEILRSKILRLLELLHLRRGFLTFLVCQLVESREDEWRYLRELYISIGVPIRVRKLIFDYLCPG